MKLIVFLTIIGLVCLGKQAAGIKTRYDGFHVFKVDLSNNEQADLLTNVVDEEDKRPDGAKNVQLWNEIGLYHSTLVIVAPNYVDQFQALLNSAGIKHKLTNRNLQSLFDGLSSLKNLSKVNKVDWSQYNDVQEIEAFLDQQVQRRPNVAKLISVGKSSHGKDIKLLKISTGPSEEGKPAKPKFWVDGGTHAREWQGPAAATYAMYALLNDPTYEDVLNGVDWYIMPVLNPDGYEYSLTDDPLWRKTRRELGPQEECVGVDPNRNYDYKWDNEGIGSSKDPCSGNYRGPYPLSEPEIKQVTEYIKKEGPILAAITFHSCGKVWMTPWAYTAKEVPRDLDEMLELANIGANGIEAFNGTVYRTGTVTDLMYAAAGSSVDWLKVKGQIKYPACIELRNTEDEDMCVLPEDQILEMGRETMAGLAAVARELMRKTQQSNDRASANL